jgi:hypothetical protein
MLKRRFEHLDIKWRVAEHAQHRALARWIGIAPKMSRAPSASTTRGQASSTRQMSGRCRRRADQQARGFEIDGQAFGPAGGPVAVEVGARRTEAFVIGEEHS